MIGVDYELFWTLNPKSLSPFFKAFSLRQEYNDAQAWNLGVYIRHAVASVISPKAPKYPNKPFSKTNKEIGDMNIIKERFWRHAAKLNANIRKEGNK